MSTPPTTPSSAASGLPVDPLLNFGSFIHPPNQTPIQGGTAGFVSGQNIQFGMSSGSDQSRPQTERKSRKSASVDRPASADSAASGEYVRPDWLPADWRVELKPRACGNAVDKYYYEPGTNLKFRSKIEVQRHLGLHVTARKSAKKGDNAGSSSDPFGGQLGNNATQEARERPVKFDFDSPPEMVSWSMPAAGKDGPWKASSGDEKVPVAVRRDWSHAFSVILTKNPSVLNF